MYRAILLAFLVAGACGSLKIGPENIAVIQGTTVVMKCLTNNESEKVLWRRQKREGEIPEKISVSNRVSPTFSETHHVNNSLPGQYDLIIRTNFSTGNQYICQEGPFGLKDGNFLSAELIVLESEPRCDINISSIVNNVITVPVNSSLQLQCTVRYSGNWEPKTEWKMLNSTSLIHYLVERTVLNDSVSLTTILTIAYDTNTHGGRYVYRLRFDESKRPNSTAKNIPDYEYIWMSPNISMAFPKHDSATGENEKILWLIVFLTILVILLFFITLILMVKKWRLKQPRIALDIIREASESHESVQNVNSRTLQNEYDHPGPPYAVIATMQSQQSVSRPEYSQQIQIPIYASVRNSKQMSESTQCLMDSNYNSPPCSEVDISRKREKQLEFPNAAFQQEVHFPESSKVIGFDGTEYAQLQPPTNETISLHTQCPRKQLYETSDYAKIDHTLTAPKIRRNLR